MWQGADHSLLSRRRLLDVAAACLVGLVGGGCGVGSLIGSNGMASNRPGRSRQSSVAQGRLTARPGPVSGAAPLGLRPLEIGQARDGLLFVPNSYRPDRPAPLAVMLHGAGGEAQGGLAPFLDLAEAAGLVLLAPESRAQTWDVLRGGYGPDITFIDSALAQIFGRYAVDPARIAVSGFSDGASYALSIGITNGDLFSDIVAFSPGFMAPADQVGGPRI